MPRPCGYLGCQNVIAAPDFPWSMCDECYTDAE